MDAADSALMAARAQFAITISFHIVLAALTLGLANFLMVLEGLWLWHGRKIYLDVYLYWLKVFALNVAVGTASGLILEYQFGLNWSRLSTQAGYILGPLMFYEVLAAFFLEAGFLGIMLFGLKKVGPRLHFFATCAVALGSMISAFWILSANSWMQTPAGYIVGTDGRLLAGDWWAIIFNPSFPYRLIHMTLAAFLGTATLVAGVSAWQLLRQPQNPRARLQFSMALWMIAVLMPVQIVVGDLHGQHSLKVQPQKIAAIEGSWERPPEGAGEPLRLFAIPDMTERRNHWEVAIPRIGSLYLRHDLSGTIAALDEFPAKDIPPVPAVFFAFRVMVGLGLLMLGLGLISLVLRWRQRLYAARWMLQSCVLMTPAGMLAMLSGWVVTEVGRQPFTVYGLLRTADSLSPVSRQQVINSTWIILVFYLLIFGIGFLVLLRLLREPPHEDELGPQPTLADETGHPEE
ncbi:cytochrome ubiquinol oxidase subunit I [Pseudomonas vancouverensis]|uniref:Cytochrome ubiquinol oxidase subunit I n=1 Tax=Pseudomonas vancouverensis TaxID=95300 RepID=A0A1H2NYS4_PSEVA|nr:cytochrome ubiquinol oxidase subunit I [Pseudomonas vancouverensis]KAB0496485.1 cytochrome ubiquinol oxidase subunit I [Pseudomonas vancouverensis]TDB64807.1 cytochrome ubiquinol oxidase subunit I [Pseudomonas vancouverensis]SDV09936.1 cytochrome bd-I ubiquinol oxidase subunit 1 apoprotein [Pseudomonas vancouverensis]